MKNKNQLTIDWSLIGAIVFSIIFPLWLFRSLWRQWQTALLDWSDYSLVVGIVQQNIVNWTERPWSQWLEIPIFYPLQRGLLLADLFWPLSLLTGIFELAGGEMIAAFNAAFFVTLILNGLLAYLLVRRFFPATVVRLTGTILLAYSPFFFSQLGHVQMIQVWLFFAALLAYWQTLEKRQTVTWWLITLIAWFLLFTASVYTAIFWFVAAMLWWIVDRALSGKPLLDRSVVGFSVCLLVVTPFLWLYRDMQQIHGVVKTQQELMTYSAQLTDYLWQVSPRTWFGGSLLGQALQSLQRHTWGEQAVFPGIALLLAGIQGMGEGIRSFRSFSPERKKLLIWAALLIVVGLVFSLGPRCMINGYYCRVPLPYWGVIKLFPPIMTIRAVARWSWLLNVGLILVALVGIERWWQSKRRWLILAFVGLYFLESIPLSFPVASREFPDTVYKELQQICDQQPAIVLEYPVPGYIPVEYRSMPVMAAAYHQCWLLNGYGGYDPYWYDDWEIAFRNDAELTKALTDWQVEYVVFNKAHAILQHKDRQNIERIPSMNFVLESNDRVLYRYEP